MHVFIMHIVYKYCVNLINHTQTMCFLGHFNFGVEFLPHQLEIY